MPKRVVITGLGIISAIGKNAVENLYSLKNNISGIGHIDNLDTSHRGNIPVAEIKLSDGELAKLAGLKNYRHFTRTALLGLVAAGEAIRSAGINVSDRNYRTGIVSATTVGGMDKTEQYYYDLLDDHGDKEFIHTHDCSDSTEKIADHYGIRGYMTTISTACSSSANSVMFAARLIKHGIADRVIAGGTDSLSKFTLNGFNTLMILDRQACRPFDRERGGLNLGEGAGYIVLESEEAALKSNKEIICELTAYANANDAYHQTASSPDGYGAYLAMKEALQMSGLEKEEIGYINAHGTGTDNNDITEGIAIEKIFSPAIPPVSSTKPFTGHTLGAAGVIEAIFSIFALREKLIFPILNFRNKIDELEFTPVRKLISASGPDNVLSNSFGFGGNDSTLIFSTY